MERSDAEPRRHVIVSGASRGLGLAMARTLVDGGYAVSCFSRKTSKEIATAVAESGGALSFDEVDVGEAALVEAFVARAVARHGPIYGVINNSAVAVDGVLATLPAVEVERMVRVNLIAPILLTRLCVRDMLLAKTAGRVINISSIVGSRGYNGLAVYSATKGALDAFTRSLARELGRRRITVNSIAPGYMRTSMSAELDEARVTQIVNRTPLGRLAELTDVTPAVLFLLSHGAAFITGQTLVIDGGVSS